MTQVSGTFPALGDRVKKRVTAVMERPVGSGAARYQLSQVRKDTLPKKPKRRAK